MPGRAFLDTTVVNFMLDYGEQIHDGAQYPGGITERTARDIDSLHKIFLTGHRAQWQFAVSYLTYQEVVSTSDPTRQYNLEHWFFEIWNYWQWILEEANDLPTPEEAERLRAELLASGALNVLPQVSDRMLICDAVAYRCDCFCTRDWSTILRHRDALAHLPLQIITPAEWWSLIEPHAALF